MPVDEGSLSQSEATRLMDITKTHREREDAAEERRWAAHIAAVEERWLGHRSDHEQLATAVDKAEAASKVALATALADHHREHGVHASAHEREHVAHSREHVMGDNSVATAAVSVDKRLEGMNEFRDQLREQARAFASSERLDSVSSAIDRRLIDMQQMLDRRFADATKHTDEKHEANRQRIEAIEKKDVKGEGKSLGQGTVVAIIVGAIALMGTLLTIVIAVANALTGA